MLTARIEPRTDLVIQARAAYRLGDWENAYAAFSRAGAVGPLAVDDQDAMATAAWHLGHDREAVRIAELVYVRLARTDPNAAAVKSVELAEGWLLRGDVNMGRNWLSRARRLMSSDGPAAGRLTYLETVFAVLTEDTDALADRAAALRELADRADDVAPAVPNLVALLSADDNHRELENRLLALSRALEETHPRAAGETYYQLGQIRRLRGDSEGAAAAYARARQLQTEPQPGEALLRFAVGDRDGAWADLLATLNTLDRRRRNRVLRGAVEIALARDDLAAAERYCDELGAGAEDWRGAVLVRRGRHAEALTALQAALQRHRAHRSAYETARVYGWMAAAHRGVGAHHLATADEAAAAELYRMLGIQAARGHGAR
ncbi:MAG: hypothetical protein KDB72_09800 [Mycobacterium sp.]|nr:hypothetical protein [Mycobacterium sp.]